MYLTDFISKWNGKPADFDGAFGNQCKDLVQYYVTEVLGNPPLPHGNAADIWVVAPHDLYQRISKTLFNRPAAGDIVIWSGSLNDGPGHIAVAVSTGLFGFTSFDQNWPVGSYCHLQPHNLRYVLGWLRPLKAVATTTQVSFDVPGTFKRVWGRPGAPGDIAYFEKRLNDWSIKGQTDLEAKMSFWRDKAKANDAAWQAEKTKVLGD
jgi:hypothetical protein